MHKHSAVQGEKGEFALHRDGQLLFCPKTVYPSMTQSAIGQVQVALMRFPCSTNCPFAQVSERSKAKPVDTGGSVLTDEKEGIYTISCEAGKLEIVLDELKNYEKKDNKPGLLNVQR